MKALGKRLSREEARATCLLLPLHVDYMHDDLPAGRLHQVCTLSPLTVFLKSNPTLR